MNLELFPSAQAAQNIVGFIIKSNSFQYWIHCLDQLGLNIHQANCYLLPGTVPNSIFGLYVQCNLSFNLKELSNVELVQSDHDLLIYPNYSKILPQYSLSELQKLVSSKTTLAHPEIGFFQLEEPINWLDYLSDVKFADVSIQIPEDDIFIPKTIKSFQLIKLNKKEELSKIENPDGHKGPLKLKPLNSFEKIKLKLLKTIYKAKKKPDLNSGGNAFGSFSNKILDQEETWLSKLIQKFGSLKERIDQKLMIDMEKLEERNQKEVEKLLSLFKNNPIEALKYAIPLDDSGAERGGVLAEVMKLDMLRSNFSLFANNASTSQQGGTVVIGNMFNKLSQQYEETAQQLIQQKDYQKAAFIYLKLLKNPYKAVEVLKQGAMFSEAASIYIKYLNDSKKAADCYEMAKMYQDAIDIYLNLKEHEKVGDLYVKLSNFKLANKHYNIVAEDYILNRQYIKAALVYRDKMNEAHKAEAYLLEAWEHNYDGPNCLKMYFSNSSDANELSVKIKNVEQNLVNASNEIQFLQVMKMVNKQANAPKKQINDIAYQIISKHAASQKSIVSELIHFNPQNTELLKDTLRYKLKN